MQRWQDWQFASADRKPSSNRMQRAGQSAAHRPQRVQRARSTASGNALRNIRQGSGERAIRVSRFVHRGYPFVQEARPSRSSAAKAATSARMRSVSAAFFAAGIVRFA